MNRLTRLFLLALPLCCSSLAVADPTPRFAVTKLSVDGNVLSVAPADVDGDGKRDLVVVYQTGPEPEPPRWFGVFWNKGGTFSSKPDVTIRVDANACAYDVADVDDAGGAELVTIGRDGAWATHFAGRSHQPPAALFTEPTVFYKPDAKALPRVRIAHDLGGKQGRRLVVPLLGAIGVFAREGGAWKATAHLPVEGKSSITYDDRLTRASTTLQSFGVGFQFPVIHVADADGDGLPDLVTATEDRVAIFRQKPGALFDAKPSYRRDFAVRTAAEAARVVQSASITVDDFDGDGIADLVVAKVVGKGITSAQTTNYLYLGRRGGGYGDSPDQTLKSDGFGGSDIEPMDLTGDKRPDLIVPTVTMGVWSVIRMLTTKMVVVKFQVYPFGAQHRFVESPTVRELKFKFSLSGDSDVPAVEMHGDYNGDKRPDLAFGSGDSELGIYPGIDAESIVTKEPIEKVKVDTRGRLIAIDLDDKGKDDIILYYPSTTSLRKNIMVLQNRGPW
ncbi:MAG: FG-GAP-like repeat-containing protein [Polyangia bacterium]